MLRIYILPFVNLILRVSTMPKLMTPAHREAFFSTLQKINPHPKTELEYTSEFELLTAVLLSAQATDVSVNKATRQLFPVANTPEAILKRST